MGTVSTSVDDLADRVWQHRLATDAYYQLKAGLPVSRLRTGSAAELDEDARLAQEVLAALNQLDTAALSADERNTTGFLRHLMTAWSEAPQSHLLTFTVTPYTGFFLTYSLQQVFGAFTFASPSDAERYLSLVADYRDYVRELSRHLQAQIDAGIRLPQPAVPGAVETLTRARAAALALLSADDDRVAALGASTRAQLQTQLDDLISTDIVGAFDQVLSLLGPAYLAAAPAEVGWEQYPGGIDHYRRLIRVQTTSELSPERIHDIGLDQVAALADEMAKLRAELGFSGTEAEFHDRLATDQRFFATDATQVEQTYLRHMAALEPKIAQLFAVVPKAPYGVARLAPQLEAGMTYGYYQVPTPAEPTGRYMYNGSALEKRSLLTAATLIFHELAPGHHFHLARQSENTDLHPLRREAMDLGAFNEGWAEYAAGLCWDLGLYDDPYDRYGRLVHERFTAQRLVVDTGMNALGWTLQQGRDYMRANTTESDLQIATETLRYATDLPGQALAYRLGFLEFERLRRHTRAALGSRFDLPTFHEVLLGPGALPFAAVAANVDAHIASPRAAG